MLRNPPPTEPTDRERDGAVARPYPSKSHHSSRRAQPGSEMHERLHGLIEELARNAQSLHTRVQQLETVTEDLRREVEIGARSVRLVMTQLAGAEERAGNKDLAQSIRDLADAGPAGSLEAALQLSLLRVARRSVERAPHGRLGPREREVLKLITEGMRSPRIAEHLGIKTATVEVHRRNIMRKLNLHSVAALTKYAVREGLTKL